MNNSHIDAAIDEIPQEIIHLRNRLFFLHHTPTFDPKGLSREITEIEDRLMILRPIRKALEEYGEAHED